MKSSNHLPAGLLPFVVRTAPTPTPLPADLHITQLRYDTADEYVEITNQGGEAQVMTGWRIQSVVGGQWYAFPDGYVLAPGAVVRVHSGPEAPNNPPADLLWGYAYVWLNEGDKAVLYDDADQEIDSACYLSGCP